MALEMLFLAAVLGPVIEPPSGKPADCPTPIHLARAAAGLPAEPESSDDKSMLVAAVDRRVAGCRVLVMANDMRDIRPEPRASHEARLRPAR